jgi:hypothetical protein
MLNLKRSSISIFFVILFYKYLVDISYLVTENRFSYAGLFFLDRSFLSSLTSWVLLIVSIPFITKAFNKNSLASKIVVTLYFISFVPTISLIGFRSDYDPYYVTLICLYWFVFLTSWNVLPKINLISTSFKSDLFFYLIILVCSLVVIYVSGRYTGFHIQTDIYNVYELRAEARGFSLSPPISYLILFADNILPFGVVYLIHQKKYSFAAILAFIVILNFSITGSKQIFALLILGVMGYWFYRFVSKPIMLPIMFSFALCLCLIEPLITDTYFLNTFFPYRVLFIPAETHYAYFSFFSVSTNQFDFFQQGPLRAFYDSDYTTGLAFLIGDFSIGDIEARANNGLFSDAYQNLGPLGILIMPILTILYLKTLDGATENTDQRLYFVLLLYISFVLLGIPLTTALLSSGLFALMLVLYFLPKNRN